MRGFKYIRKNKNMRSLTSKMYMLHQPNVNQILLYEAVAILAQDITVTIATLLNFEV